MIIKENGLKIETLKEGTGDFPTKGDTVLMHYILYLGTGVSSAFYDYDKHCYIDDLVDSTYEDIPMRPAGPIKIIIGSETPKDSLYSEGDSIEGISEALLSMRPGSKCRLLIPSHLAYGEEGASSFHSFHGYRTPPYRGLDMIVELLEIKKRDGGNK